MAASPIDTYRREIEKALQADNATEHRHRLGLKNLTESLALWLTATNEPKHVECVAPDFIVSCKTAHGLTILGHIEAEDVGTNLDEIEQSVRLNMYLFFSNVILTNY